MLNKQAYLGRFAPSPSGPLHFGSLVCALASFLHARQADGQWLLRIEDVDTPRIDPAYNSVILHTLEAHGLYWDGKLSYQSEHHQQYEHALALLAKKKAVYACECSRRQIRARAPYYDRRCRERSLSFEGHALRFKNDAAREHFIDTHYGDLRVPENMAKEDPVLKRADGIYAYHLAVVVDDIAQGINHIVRGADLIDTTPLHISLFEAFDAAPPSYLHIPVAASTKGQKLSKQHHATPINDAKALDNLKSAMIFLGCNATFVAELDSVETALSWGIEHWQAQNMRQQTEILVSERNGVYCVDTF